MTQKNGRKATRKRTRSYKKHGLTAAKTALRTYGMRTLDGRTRAARELSEWRSSLIADLGGEQNVSAQQRAIIELCVHDVLLLGPLEAYLASMPSIVNKQKRRVYDVVLQRNKLADGLAGRLKLLGLEKHKPPAEDLSSYLEGKAEDAELAPLERSADVATDDTNGSEA